LSTEQLATPASTRADLASYPLRDSSPLQRVPHLRRVRRCADQRHPDGVRLAHRSTRRRAIRGHLSSIPGSSRLHGPCGGHSHQCRVCAGARRPSAQLLGAPSHLVPGPIHWDHHVTWYRDPSDNNRSVAYVEMTDLAFNPVYIRLYPWLVDGALASVVPFVALLVLNVSLLREVRRSTRYLQHHVSTVATRHGPFTPVTWRSNVLKTTTGTILGNKSNETEHVQLSATSGTTQRQGAVDLLKATKERLAVAWTSCWCVVYEQAPWRRPPNARSCRSASCSLASSSSSLSARYTEAASLLSTDRFLSSSCRQSFPLPLWHRTNWLRRSPPERPCEVL